MDGEPQIGDQLREARKRAGLSLDEMARRANYTKGHLSNVESGARRPTPGVLLAYETVCGDEMERRTLLTGIASSVIAPMVADKLLRGAFTQALGPRVTAEEWRARAEEYGAAYMTLGAADLSSRLVGDMIHLQQSVREDPGIWAPAARLMTVYGKTLPANDGSEGAVTWYRLAAQVADRSQDLPVKVWVRGRAAIALAYEGADIPTASVLAAEAIGLANGKPSLGLLNALSATAHVAGVRGDKATALRAIRAAERVFEAVGSGDTISDFAVPEWRFWVFQSMLWARLGDEERALRAQEAARRLLPSSLPRFKTHLELHRGLMLVNAGDTEGGLEYAQSALDLLPPERRSLSLRLMMAEVRRSAGKVRS